ncbi:unnamed protein product [Camellia sinensis]
MGIPAYLQPDLEADLVLPSTPAGRVNYQVVVDKTSLLRYGHALISLAWETQKQSTLRVSALGCVHFVRRMDVVWGETAGVDGQLWLLAPILFILQKY